MSTPLMDVARALPVGKSELVQAAIHLLDVMAYHRAGGAALVVAMEMPKAIAELQTALAGEGVEPGALKDRMTWIELNAVCGAGLYPVEGRA